MVLPDTYVLGFDQESAKRRLRSSSQTAICYYQSNHSKVEAIPLSGLNLLHAYLELSL